MRFKFGIRLPGRGAGCLPVNWGLGANALKVAVGGPVAGMAGPER